MYTISVAFSVKIPVVIDRNPEIKKSFNLLTETKVFFLQLEHP